MSIFSQAKALPEPKTKAKAKATDGVEVKGLEDYALIDALIKSLGAVKDTLAVAIKDESRELFVSVKDKKRPPNLKAYDGDATASIQLQKRSTRSPLSTDEVELLLLGAVEIHGADGPVAIGPTARTLLAALLVSRREVVSLDHLADVLWADHPPATARPASARPRTTVQSTSLSSIGRISAPAMQPLA